MSHKLERQAREGSAALLYTTSAAAGEFPAPTQKSSPPKRNVDKPRPCPPSTPPTSPFEQQWKNCAARQSHCIQHTICTAFWGVSPGLDAIDTKVPIFRCYHSTLCLPCTSNGYRTIPLPERTGWACCFSCPPRYGEDVRGVHVRDNYRSFVDYVRVARNSYLCNG